MQAQLALRRVAACTALRAGAFLAAGFEAEGDAAFVAGLAAGLPTVFTVGLLVLTGALAADFAVVFAVVFAAGLAADLRVLWPVDYAIANSAPVPPLNAVASPPGLKSLESGALTTSTLVKVKYLIFA
jgi:hypothetical protein